MLDTAVLFLFPVQAEVIPALLESAQQGLLLGRGGYKPRDMCVSAPTGSGKTLAFVVPVIQVRRHVCNKQMLMENSLTLMFVLIRFLCNVSYVKSELWLFYPPRNLLSRFTNNILNKTSLTDKMIHRWKSWLDVSHSGVQSFLNICRRNLSESCDAGGSEEFLCRTSFTLWTQVSVFE